MADERVRERDRAAVVVRQDGKRVEVNHKGERLTVPMQGFPDGFTLRPGARVILVDEASGVAARPLVRAVETRSLDHGAVARRAPLEVQGRPVEMQSSTVLEEQPATQASGEEYVVWVVERAEPDATDQAIAVRRQ